MIVFILNLLSLTGLIALVLLMPSFLLINVKYNSVSAEMKKLELEIPEIKNSTDLELQASVLQDKLNLLGDISVTEPLSVWKKIVADQSDSIKIKSFSYVREGSIVHVYVRGTALSREALTNFSKSLESQEEFRDVNLPISNLTRDKDLDFSISFSIGTEEQDKS